MVRRFLTRWHSDVREGHHVESAESSDLSVAQVLTQLNPQTKEWGVEGLQDLSYWPSYFQTGMRINFPSIGASSNRNIFLPRTPREFFELLEYIEEHDEFPAHDYPRVEISKHHRGGHRRDSEPSQSSDDATILEVVRFATNSESIEELSRIFDLLSLFGRAHINASKLPEAVDARALHLFKNELARAQTKQNVQLIRSQIERFKFFDSGARSRTIALAEARSKDVPESLSEQRIESGPSAHEIVDTQKEARRIFVEKARVASTPEQLKALLAESDEFSFFNRGELGVVRSVISRKLRNLAE